MAYTPKLTYKGRPLVRCGNDIYYGSMKDPFVDETKPLPERIARQANKVGLYNALSFGDIMLQGALQKK